MAARKSVIGIIAVLVAALFFGTAPRAHGEEGACSSCAECEGMLASGTYTTVYLAADIIDQPGSCIRLDSGESNIVFDCQGHTIDGDEEVVNSERGISIMHGSNITVTDCTISDFDAGIYLVDATANFLTGNRILSNHRGIEMIHVWSNVVSENRVSDNVTGIKISDANYNELWSNFVCGNSLWDIYYSNGMENVGDGNTCDTSHYWNDEGTSDCSSECPFFADGFESGCCGGWGDLPEGDLHFPINVFLD